MENHTIISEYLAKCLISMVSDTNIFVDGGLGANDEDITHANRLYVAA